MLSPQLFTLYCCLWLLIWYSFLEDRCQIISKFILDEGFLFNFLFHQPLLIHLAPYAKVEYPDTISATGMIGLID